jgi:preprotein translocase subunit SecE
VAERKRRGEDPAAENPDEQLFDEAEDDLDELDDAEFDEPAARSVPARSGGTATKARPRAEGRPVKKEAGRGGPIARIGRFIREVVAELRKVIWPTRKELLTYTAVVIVFVSVVMAIVAGLDVGFAKLVLLVFGSSSSE